MWIFSVICKKKSAKKPNPEPLKTPDFFRDFFSASGKSVFNYQLP